MIVACAISLWIGNNHAEAQSGANVLVVINSTSAASETIGRRYAEKRGVPQDNVCSIQVPANEAIARQDYERLVETPIWQCITTHRAHDRILYIVLTKDVPIRINGTGGRGGTTASVDSELTVLYRRRSGVNVPVVGFVPNPYFAGTSPPAAVKAFNHDAMDIYLVTRLDGYTEQDALGLIDKASAPSREGRFVLDQRASFVDSGGNAWLKSAAERLQGQGFGDRVVLDESAGVVTDEKQVLGYYSWGSNDTAIKIRRFGMEFVPGALAGMFVSTDGRTFKEPPATWTPSDKGQGGIFGGSHQSLMPDLIREGVTGAAGHVAEPYLDATIRPEILFPAYVSGRNLAEAYYSAMPYLSWMTVIVGDPLCAPFPRTPLTTQAIDAGIDQATELPSHFGKRRLAAIPSTVNREAAAAFVRYESRLARKDSAAARQALETAVIADPRFTLARLELANVAEESANYDRAIAHYRAVLAYSPNEPTALNNLAYALAVRKNNPQEALPVAERAVAVSKNAVFLDTLAWTQYLLKRYTEALANIRLARSSGIQDGDIFWHSAAIHAAANDLPRAAAELKLALQLKPDLAERDEVKKLQQLLPPAR